MKKLAVFIFTFLLVYLSGCGLSSRNNELVGQVKKVVHVTPLLCPDEVDVDISLGVMRNGVGSMSNQDVWIRVTDSDQEKLLKEAVTNSSIVKVTYDDQRVRWCWVPREATQVEIVK